MIGQKDGKYHCFICGSSWKPRQRRQWWPIRIVVRRAFHVGTHSWVAGWDGIEQAIVGWVLHLGWLKLIFGHLEVPDSEGLQLRSQYAEHVKQQQSRHNPPEELPAHWVSDHYWGRD